MAVELSALLLSCRLYTPSFRCHSRPALKPHPVVSAVLAEATLCLQLFQTRRRSASLMPPSNRARSLDLRRCTPTRCLVGSTPTCSSSRPRWASPRSGRRSWAAHLSSATVPHLQCSHAPLSAIHFYLSNPAHRPALPPASHPKSVTSLAVSYHTTSSAPSNLIPMPFFRSAALMFQGSLISLRSYPFPIL